MKIVITAGTDTWEELMESLIMSMPVTTTSSAFTPSEGRVVRAPVV